MRQRSTVVCERHAMRPAPRRPVASCRRSAAACRCEPFADWKDPHPGSMEMDLVGHCGERNKGSYVHSLAHDIASGWTECAPLVVRESGLLIETLEHIRTGLPSVVRALEMSTTASEFVNEAMIHYCFSHGIELTRSRPYRKNDQAWIDQKNGAVGMLGERRSTTDTLRRDATSLSATRPGNRFCFNHCHTTVWRHSWLQDRRETYEPFTTLFDCRRRSWI